MNHVIRAGEHLVGIALAHGFECVETVWNDPANEELAAQRGDPCLLLEGDVVVIPDKQAKEVEKPTMRAHRFVLKRTLLQLRVRVLDVLGEPVADTPGELVIGGQSFPVQTDGDGLLETTIPRTTKAARLVVGEVTYELLVGALDPGDESTGLEARLNNLGYWSGDQSDDDPEALRVALLFFQHDNDLPLTGEADGPTVAKLLEAHGC